MPEGVKVFQLQDQAPERFVRLRDPLDVSSFGINQIILAPGQRNRIHRHRHQEEVYVVLSGELTLVIEGEPHRYPAGALISVAPQVRRQLTNHGPEPVSMLVVGGMVGHEHSPRDGEPFTAWEDTEPGTPETVPSPADLPASELR